MEQIISYMRKLALESANLAKRFHEKTAKVAELLSRDDDSIIADESFVPELNDLIESRDEIIKNYNSLQSIYNKLGKSLGEALPPDIECLIKERRNIFSATWQIDERNVNRIKALYGLVGGNVREIHRGRQLFNAYSDNVNMSDGVFFDKRK